jgi:hypothetical protein
MWSRSNIITNKTLGKAANYSLINNQHITKPGLEAEPAWILFILTV